ncbi:methionyl-tRNA formyltransferase [soil metagenome]
MKIVFMGTPAAAVPSLKKVVEDGHDVVAVYTQPDRPSGRGNKIVYSPVKQFAIDHGLKVFQPVKIKTPEALSEFESHQADIAVVVAYGRILAEGFLNAYLNGAVNVHFSLLPKYRGAAPVNWAIAEGETETGVTTMKMDAGLDTGDVLLQSSTQIGSEENAIELMSRLSDSGAELLSQTLAHLPTITPQKQDNSRATLAPILKKEDGRIDWTMTAVRVSDRIRGFQPFPGSFTKIHGKRVKILAARPVIETVNSGQPGQVIEAEPTGLLVACGEDVLQLLEVQPEGKKRMVIADFLNGFRLKKGEVFGQ